ncbi:hypothetical protein BDR04DRAFT_1147346 [Suillus decipiens]|nr:hypothetical protein BDR04DRAFT_1147346 [Suillus decipiens]
MLLGLTALVSAGVLVPDKRDNIARVARANEALAREESSEPFQRPPGQQREELSEPFQRPPGQQRGELQNHFNAHPDNSADSEPDLYDYYKESQAE